MPSVALSGFTANSAKNLVLGPGLVYINYGLTGERILGMTNGGNSFNPGITFRDIESDRQFMGVKGLRILDELNPTITTNLMELSVANLKAVVPGLVEVPWTTAETSATGGNPTLVNWTRLRMGTLADSHYFANVALVATHTGSNYPVICILNNAIADGEIEISLENKSEVTTEVTFTGTFTPASLETLAKGTATLESISPFEVRWPVAAATV